MLEARNFSFTKEGQAVIKHWQAEYNTRHAHSALGYSPPAPAAHNPLGASRLLSQFGTVM